MSDLKPCPFCGGAAHFFKLTDLDEKNFGGEGICCGSCPITTDLMFSLMEDCKPKLAEAWNRRAQPAPITSETGNQAAQGASAITSESVPLLTVEEIQAAWVAHGLDDCAVEDFAKAIEQAVRAKMGVGVGWQPIETAPKDGTRVLLVINHGEWGDAVWTGLWADGWMVSYGKAQANPTHWMPLPPPPIVGKEGGNV